MIQYAKWIAPAGAETHKPCHFRAEKTFFLDSIPETTVCQITCDGNYYLEINGRYVGRGPARGTRSIAYYDEYEVRDFLHCGENRISILSVCMNFPAEASQPITPAVRAALSGIAVTDAGWETFMNSAEWIENGPFFTAQSGYAEWRDLRYTGNAAAAETIIVPESSPLTRKRLLKRDIPMPLELCRLPVDIPAAALVPPCDPGDKNFARISTTEEHFPLGKGGEAALYGLISGDDENIVLPQPENRGGVTLVVDFGKEISGFAEIVLTAPAGCVADIAYEESLWQGERLRADHSHTNPTYNFAERYVLRAGRQQIGGVLMERGFRMIQLTVRNIGDEPVILHRVRAIDRRYPFAAKGQFFCGDYQLNRLWECAGETISACTTDIFTDCPWRERLFYCNDYYIENRVALKMFGDKKIHQRAMRMIFSSNRQDALFTSCSPAIDYEIPDGDKTDYHIILSGDLTLPLVLKEYYMHTADAEAVKNYFAPLQRMMCKIASWKDERGVIMPPVKYWNFIDWSFELNGMAFSGKGSALLNFLYIIAGKAMLAMSDTAGSDFFETPETLEKMVQQTVEVFYRPDEGIFLNTDEGSAASMAVLKSLGVPPRDDFQLTETSRLVHALAALAGADPEICMPFNDESLLTPELYYCIFLLDAMEKSGCCQDALKLIRKHWGKMLDSGTPTLWENGVHSIGKAGFGGSASLCHGFSSAPAAFLQSAVLGIKPLAPGFAVFAFAPACPEIGFAQGTVPTPYGAIRCKWQRQGDEMTAELHIPENCSAETPQGVLSAGNHSLRWNL